MKRKTKKELINLFVTGPQKNRVMLKRVAAGSGVFDTLGAVQICYEVGADNGTTTVTANMELIREKGFRGAWSASIIMDNFPPQKTAAAAALKLADWMTRLGRAIQSGEYENIEVEKL